MTTNRQNSWLSKSKLENSSKTSSNRTGKVKADRDLMGRVVMEGKALADKVGRVLEVKVDKDSGDKISREDSAVTAKEGTEDRIHMVRVDSEDKEVKVTLVDKEVLEVREDMEDMEVLTLTKSQLVTT